MEQYHQPVLLKSVSTWLNITAGSKYIDATIGGGGHTLAILNQGGRVLGIDQDRDAIDYLSIQSPFLPALDSGRLVLVRDNFSNLARIVRDHSWLPTAGIIFDLGVSWHQLSTPSRGFSYKLSGPLDMRMDQRLTPSAATLVNGLSVKQLAQILTDFGELPNSSYLARKIVASRPLTTTTQLAQIIGRPAGHQQRIFQALRMAVNGELIALESGLSAGMDIISSGGRIVVISFHSIEDRLVKNIFIGWQQAGLGQILTRRPVTPTPEEIRTNPKCHSAKLRIFEKK